MRRLSARLAAVVVLSIASPADAEPASDPMPPSPFLLVPPQRRTPPFLDAAPACVPGAEREGVARIAAHLRAQDAEGARRALDHLAKEPERGSPDRPLLEAIVAARAAVGSDRGAALRGLETALLRHPDPAARACARLERARGFLRLGQPAAARIELARARRDERGSTTPVTASPGARWLAAEAAHLSGVDEEARAIYEQLSSAADARLARAASLRRAEAAFPVASAGMAADPESIWRTLPGGIHAASELGIDVEAFALVAGELALRVRDYGAAHHWLARAERPWPGGLASIRKADALRLLGRRDDARRVLERVVRTAAHAATRELAQARLAEERLKDGDREGGLDLLRAVARSSHPRVRTLAQDRIARELALTGATDQALQALVRLAYADPTRDLAPSFPETFERVIGELAGAAAPDCARLLEGLGGRRSLLVRHSRDPGPLLGLGDCFLSLGLPGAALDSYRAAGRAFGFDRAPRVSLRLAQASLEHGDWSALKAALAAELGAQPGRDADPERARWLWLAARLDEREGRREAAGETLRRLAEGDALPPELRIDVELALARLAGDGLAPEAARAALERSLARPADGEASARAMARLRLADLLGEAGDADAARSAYRRAAAELPGGGLRDRALHHAAALAAAGSERREALRVARGDEAASPWSRVAAVELRLASLREGLGAR